MLLSVPQVSVEMHSALGAYPLKSRNMLMAKFLARKGKRFRRGRVMGRSKFSMEVIRQINSPNFSSALQEF